MKLYAQAVKVVAKFKDFSKRRRPVSHVSWQKQAPVLAVSHCSPGTVSPVACWTINQCSEKILLKFIGNLNKFFFVYCFHSIPFILILK